ncbi:MAG: type I-E CRISPR-associated protein Cse1/CasA [Phycisphaerae bacterium]|nr:type I-E CRISPR-associated protein Cse1/CasA [Phycisphaerae bacterium]
MEYNLLDEKWIPVLYLDGRFDRVGILRALTEAGRIRQIAAPNPMDRVALIRFLVAILYWCKGNPRGQDEKDQILRDGRFPTEWFAKLEQHRECFSLLGDAKRFYQDPSAKRLRAATDLLQEIPTGNNFWHFRHSTDAQESLCPACCTMGLLRLPLFSVSGLPDLKSGINGTPPIYAVPIGRSLLHTLCLNWIHCVSLGLPVWEEFNPALLAGAPVPTLNGLTMLSRRVWLHDPAGPGGLCIGCGRQESALIRMCEFQSAGKQQNDAWDDPHVIYSKRKAKDGSVRRKALTTPDPTKPLFRTDKPWTSLLMEPTWLSRFGGHPGHVQLLVVGLATDKAKNIDVWERTCAIPPQVWNGVAGPEAAGRIKIWDEEGKKLPARMKAGGSNSRGVEFTAATGAIRPEVEARVSARISELLTSPEAGWAQAVQEYRRMASVVAKSLAPGFTTRALQCRERIAGVVPQMTVKPAAEPRKSRAKKGDEP